MNLKNLDRLFLPAAIAALLMAYGLHAQQSGRVSTAAIPQDRLVQPEQFQQELQTYPHAALILQVGSRILFDEAHIPGAEYAGPASLPEGLQALRTRVSNLPRDGAIVIYCGCCPWNDCPNMGPAWQLLHSMGFTHVRALYLADNFGADWVAKGYRVDKSQ